MKAKYQHHGVAKKMKRENKSSKEISGERKQHQYHEIDGMASWRDSENGK